MKKISILIPCYNEEGNILLLYNEVMKMLASELAAYDYEILFIDNHSTDSTISLLREIAAKNKKVKCILNARNVGSAYSTYYGLCQTKSDCTVILYADFQEPIDMIPVFVKEWEKGYKVVIGIKTKSKENPVMRLLRTVYYKLFKKLSEDVKQIKHFDGFGLYDKSFINLINSIHEPTPYIKNIVAEFGFSRKEIPYTQEKRRSGKSHINWYTLYNDAMLGITSHTKFGIRLCTICGFIFSFISLFVSLSYLIMKIIFWDNFTSGMAPVLIGVFFLGSLQLFFIGFIGEYIMAINIRIMNRPLVIEEERINFDSKL